MTSYILVNAQWEYGLTTTHYCQYNKIEVYEKPKGLSRWIALSSHAR